MNQQSQLVLFYCSLIKILQIMCKVHANMGNSRIFKFCHFSSKLKTFQTKTLLANFIDIFHCFSFMCAERNGSKVTFLGVKHFFFVQKRVFGQIFLVKMVKLLLIPPCCANARNLPVDRIF